jgi:hypothetical protein
MACRFFRAEDGGTMFVCSRGKSAYEPDKCYVCGEPAVLACDYSTGSALSICTRTMCEKHAIRVDIDTHVCLEHSSELHMRKARHIRKQLAEQLGWSIPMENCDGDGI